MGTGATVPLLTLRTPGRQITGPTGIGSAGSDRATGTSVATWRPFPVPSLTSGFFVVARGA